MMATIKLIAKLGYENFNENGSGDEKSRHILCNT